MKKTISLLLVFIMSFSCFSFVSFAETTKTAEHLTEVPEGYIGVYTVEDLYFVRNDLNANYILMNDIDLSEATAEGGEWNYGGRGWNPIGSNDIYSNGAFGGIFEGNNYSVTGMNIDIDAYPAGTGLNVYVGLFANVSGTVKNLTVEGRITTERVYGWHGNEFHHYFGGIASYISNSGKIQNCKNKVNLYITIPHSYVSTYVGGIAGETYGIIENCSNFADIEVIVTNGDVGMDTFVAGITANYNGHSSLVSTCVNSGNIYVDNKTSARKDSYACGISWNNASNCYNKGNVTVLDYFGANNYYARGISSSVANNCYNVGRILCNNGYSSFNYSYAINNDSRTTNCYYLEGSGQGSTGATSLTEAQMKLQGMYSGWDFDTVWTMEGREDYPYPELRDVPLILPEDLNHKHEYTSEITKEATHTEDGETTYTCECGDTYTEVIAKLADHTYEEVVTSPTCTAQGYTTYTCSCGDSYVTDYTDKLNHEYTSEVTTPATHLTEGVETYTCACGDTYSEVIAKLTEHTYTSEVTKEATHLAEGVETFTCDCGDTYTEAIAKLTKHTYEKVVTEPTCTAKGYTIYTCECGDTYTEEITAIGHKELVIPSVEATCTDEGLYAGKICEACGEELASQQIIPAKGHKFSDWIVISEVTCDTNGRKVRICACGAVEEDVENSYGHNDADDDNKCDNCDENLKAEVNTPAEKDNLFTFLKSFLNNLIEFFRQLLGIKK